MGEPTGSLASGEPSRLPDSVGAAEKTRLKMLKMEMKGADM